MRAHVLRSGVTAALALSVVFALLALLPATPADAQDPPRVEAGNVFYSPEALEVEVGATVLFDNVAGNHSFTSDDCGDPVVTADCYANAAGDVFDSGAMQAPFDYEFTFDEPGSFAYFCRIHSSPDGTSQNGTITVVQAGDPDPEPEPEPDPVSGNDPVETALSWSARLPDGGANTALVGTDGGFADSLASGAAQGLLDAPLLLTDGETLDPRVTAELARLGVDRVIVLGGTAAISEAVEAELAQTVMTTERAGGDTRLTTARAVADLVAPDATSVILARAFGEGSASFADSLGAGAVAALTGDPVVLTPTEGLDPALATWLTENAVQEVAIAGGVAAVSQQVQDDLTALGITATRYAGGTRFSTAAALRALADQAAPTTVVEGTTDLAWASGFAAALTSPGGILLSAGTELPGDTLDGLLGTGDVVCGPTIGANACGQARAAGAADPEEAGALTAVMDVDQQVAATPTAASGFTTVLQAGEDGMCFMVDNFDLSGPVTAAHIHAAAFGTAGDIVVPFVLGVVDGSSTQIACTPAIDPAVVDAIYADPAAHYVNIHTELNPMGEVRGQLFPLVDVLTATLNGANEVPGPGDPTALGAFRLYDTGVVDELCYVIDQGDLAPAALMAHIHAGDAATAGDVVHPLQLGPGPVSAGCDRGVDPALRTQILTTPSQFYCNLHNEPFPGGAIRGQLDGSVS